MYELAVEGACGGSPRVIERELGLLDYYGFVEEWKRFPTVRMMVAGYFKIKPRPRNSEKRDSSGDFEAFLRAFGAQPGQRGTALVRMAK